MIKNSVQFNAAIEKFIEDNNNFFINEEKDALNLDIFYIKKRNEYNERLNNLQKQYPLHGVQEFINEWRYNNNSKTNNKTDFELLETFCKSNELDVGEIALAKAEFEAIQKVFSQNLLSKVRDHKPITVESLDDFLKRIENMENSFCKAMPINVPIEFFKVFIEKKNKLNKFYLSHSQFITFIEQAFLNKRPINKIKMNLGNRENGLVIKRFFEFFILGSAEYENTLQCKSKYINLVLDNFTNWTYKQLKNNSRNRTRKEW